MVWTNPIEKNTRQKWLHLPQGSGWTIKNCLSCHHPSNFPGRYTWKSSARKTLTKHGFYFSRDFRPTKTSPPTCTPVPRWATRFAGLSYWTQKTPQLSEVGELTGNFWFKQKPEKMGVILTVDGRHPYNMYKGFWKIPVDAGVFPINVAVMMLMHSKLWKFRSLRYPTLSNLGLCRPFLLIRKFRQLRLQT